MVVRARIDATSRLNRVGYNILVAGADLCREKVSTTYGFSVLSEEAFEDEFRPAARLEGFSNAIEVAAVVPTSPAARAGLQQGDELVRIGDWTVTRGGESQLKAAVEKLVASRKTGAPLALRVLRGGAEHELVLRGDPACDFPVVAGTEDVVNAYADGERIVIEKGMLRFASDERDLALVVSHELAHNAMGHVGARRTNAMVGGALGFLVDLALAAATAGAYSDPNFTRAGAEIGAGSYSVEFEQEADYVGMYFMKRAGYDISGAPGFWRRMAVERPESIELRRSHPTTPERFIGLQVAIDEIEAKSAAGAALMPEMKGQ